MCFRLADSEGKLGDTSWHDLRVEKRGVVIENATRDKRLSRPPQKRERGLLLPNTTKRI